MHITVGDKRLLLVWSHKITVAILLHMDWCGFVVGNLMETCQHVAQFKDYPNTTSIVLFCSLQKQT